MNHREITEKSQRIHRESQRNHRESQRITEDSQRNHCIITVLTHRFCHLSGGALAAKYVVAILLRKFDSSAIIQFFICIIISNAKLGRNNAVRWV